MNVTGADPHILFDTKSGYYYCYATSNTGNNYQFYIYKSKDLIKWEHVGYALDTNDENNWAKGWYWAPECYYNPHNNHYYLFYSALVKDELVEKYFADENYEECTKIGVAVSSSPEGPFRNITDYPLDYYPYDPNYQNINLITDNVFSSNMTIEKGETAPRGIYLSSIDANVFFDEDGKIYLYYSRCCYRNCVYDPEYKKYIEESNILCVELTTSWWFDKTASSMPTIHPSYISYSDDKNRRQDRFNNIINYHMQPQKWENGHVFDYENYGKKNRRWSEGSTTFSLNIDGKNKYGIIYSCNCFENALYGVGIAFSDSPIKNFKKYENNPIIHQITEDNLYSTGHGTIVSKDNKYYYFFHGRDDVYKDRILYVAEIIFNDFDNIEIKNITKCSLIKK